jgi:hypothetical protein
MDYINNPESNASEFQALNQFAARLLVSINLNNFRLAA